jgi:hypothetical protein
LQVPFTERLDDRNTAGDRRFIGERHALGLGRFGERRAMQRQHRLVGGDHALAAGDGRVAGLLRRAIGTADHLDEDVDVRRFRHGDRIVEPLHGFEIEPAVAALVARRHGDDADRPAAARFEQLALNGEKLKRSRADGA